MKLTAEDFAPFFEGIHGHPPLPWQVRLARTVLATGWPSTLSLPTASGKTAVLDVAVFALAVEARLPTPQRNACRRIALVVDRRIVVDDATRRAERIRDAIRDASAGVLASARAALRELAGARGSDAEPLQVATLRGGIYREDRWATSPRQPAILCSTVDQVGSRLLHRGYGVSARMASIHAGLLGNDCCIILDEAHISEPFRQTLDWVARYRSQAERAPATPFRVVTMTATPREEREPFRLSAEDRAHPVLAPRLTARKEAALVVADATDKELEEAAVEGIRQVLAWRPESGATADVRTVLVVLNRVASARALFAALTPARRPPVEADVLLLTGRARSLERDQLLREHRERIMAGRDVGADSEGRPRHRDPEGARPLIVVATQCVEVGADLDLDALVTEAAPIDALRQRLGRVDRLGRRGRSPVRVIARPDVLGTAAAPGADPIYGPALGHSWRWLHTLPLSSDGTRDLGIAGLEEHAPPDHCAAPAEDAPIMLPAYCDLWVQTGPEPAHSPDPGIFLHGPRRESAEVRLVWRADLDPARPATWADTVACCPPMTSESLPLPLHVARAWMAGVDARRLPDGGGDLPDAQQQNDAEAGPDERPALRWRGPEESGLVSAQELRPGDVLVLPCSVGGCDQFGWNPASPEATDLADASQVAGHRPAVLRLSPLMAGLPESLRAIAQWQSDTAQGWPDDWRDQIDAALESASAAEGPLGEIVRALVGGTRTSEPHPAGVGVVITGKRRLGLEFTDQDHTSSIGEEPRELIPHLEDVASWANHHAQGLPPELAGDLTLAGRLHDLGKADPRFQAWLAGGDPVTAARAGLLAKSRRLPPGRAASEAARSRAGYPVGARHELLSVRLAESCPDLLAKAHDRELVLHLIACHHGHCRPLAPVVLDERPLAVRLQFEGKRLSASTATGLEHLESGVPERFWSLVRRYGWWGLSYLEACLRLADHRASELPGEEHRP